MATHGMHNTTLSKSQVVHRVACVWPVHHQEDGKSDGLDEDVEQHNGVFFYSQSILWASVSVPTDSVPTTQSPKREVGTIALWPQAMVC